MESQREIIKNGPPRILYTRESPFYSGQMLKNIYIQIIMQRHRESEAVGLSMLFKYDFQQAVIQFFG